MTPPTRTTPPLLLPESRLRISSPHGLILGQIEEVTNTDPDQPRDLDRANKILRDAGILRKYWISYPSEDRTLLFLALQDIDGRWYDLAGSELRVELVR